MTDLFVVIPTYWTWPQTASAPPTTASFDHPTPLDGESTLPALLDDLCVQQDAGFEVLVLTGLAHVDLAGDVSEHVRNILELYRGRLRMRVVDGPALRRMLDPTRLSDLPTELLHLQSYAAVRNLQLLVPHALGAEVIVALDDDERVEPDYITLARRFIGTKVQGHAVLGLGGPYLQRDGSVLLPEPAATGNPFHDKARYINAAMRLLTESQDAPVPSPMALGGNMLIHRDAFSRICFDPAITRGEDIDYLINARLQGVRWWFDPGLTVLHLPPRHYDSPAYQRMREDLFRFVYEREKLRMHGQHRPDWLEPYPGVLLSDELERQALAALEAEATPELTGRFGTPAAILEQARAHAALHLPRFDDLQKRWARLMRGLQHDRTLRGKLRGAVPPF